MILICFVMTGQLLRLQFKGRVEYLEKTILMIEIIQTQLSFVNSDITSLLIMLCENRSLNKLVFIKKCKELINNDIPFEKAWEESIKSFSSSLSNNDKSILISFGSQLGKSDLQGQINNCLLHKQRLEFQLNNAQSQMKKYGNLCFRLGCLSGILMMIIFC